MKKSIVLVFLCFFSLYGIEFSLAGCLGKNGLNIKILKRATGEVSEIDTDAKIITIKHKVNEKEVKKVFIFDNSTNIMDKNESMSVTDLKKGDKITIFYLRDGSNNLAKSITMGKE